MRHIVWPGEDSDDEEDDDSYPLSIRNQTVGFLKKYIETGKFEMMLIIVMVMINNDYHNKCLWWDCILGGLC